MKVRLIQSLFFSFSFSFLSAKDGLEASYKSFPDNGEREKKNHFKFLKHQCTYDAMMHNTQGTKKQITYTVLHNPSHLIVEYNKNLTEDGDKLNFNAILYQ